MSQQFIRLQHSARHRQLRRLAAVTVIAIVAAGASVVALSQRPQIAAALRTALPAAQSEVILAGASRDPSKLGSAQLAELLLTPGPSHRRDDSEETAQLLVPVQAASCPHLVRLFGGACGGMRGQARRLLAPTEISWSAGAHLEISTRGLKSLKITPPPAGSPRNPLGSWAVAPQASETRISVDCLGPSRLTVSGGASTQTGAGCVTSHATEWRLPLRFAGSPSSPRIGMIDLTSLHLHARSKSASMIASRASLRVGDSLDHLQSRNGTEISMVASASDPVRFSLQALNRPSPVHVALDSSSTTSVTATASELVPTRYQRHRELFLALAFAVFAGLATAWLDRFILLY